MFCPNCGSQNDEDVKFCIKCGTPIRKNIQSGGQQTPSSIGAPEWRATVNQIGSYAKQGGGMIAGLNIWPPFAGYGSRRRHIGWVLDGKGEYAEELTHQVDDRFSKREIPNTSISKQMLTAKGVFVEERPYFILQHNLASMALNISKFGKDLFISIASYIKPPISNFRAILLVIMVAYQLFITFIFPAMIASAIDDAVGSIGLFGNSSGNPDALISLLCIFGPIGSINSLLLLIIFLYSSYKWLTEKDFFAILRVQPNEFNEDDLMALEKAVEQTVRQSMDVVAGQEGIDVEWPEPIIASMDRRMI